MAKALCYGINLKPFRNELISKQSTTYPIFRYNILSKFSYFDIAILQCCQFESLILRNFETSRFLDFNKFAVVSNELFN